MKLQLLLFAGLAGMLTFASCDKVSLHGDGPTISETRHTGAFEKISMNGSVPVRVFKDDSYYVVVSGYQNLVSAYRTSISGDRLTLEFSDDYINIKNNNITVEVHTPYTREVAVNGSGSITVNSGFSASTFSAYVNGSGRVEVGPNNFTLMRAEINGSGNVNANSLMADEGSAQISGSGTINIYASEYLWGRISGSGTVNYWGDPFDTDLSVSGSGHFSRR